MWDTSPRFSRFDLTSATAFQRPLQGGPIRLGAGRSCAQKAFSCPNVHSTVMHRIFTSKNADQFSM
jgi:hypothetical protein